MTAGTVSARRFCCAVPIRHTVVDVVDRDVDDAVARSFLAGLPAELAGRLRAEGERADYPAGTTVYRAGDDPRAALVVRGLLRVYLSSPGGRHSRPWSTSSPSCRRASGRWSPAAC